MSSARPLLPLQSALAARARIGVLTRAEAVDGMWRSGMTHAIVAFPIYRGLTR